MSMAGFRSALDRLFSGIFGQLPLEALECHDMTEISSNCLLRGGKNPFVAKRVVCAYQRPVAEVWKRTYQVGDTRTICIG